MKDSSDIYKIQCSHKKGTAADTIGKSRQLLNSWVDILILEKNPGRRLIIHNYMSIKAGSYLSGTMARIGWGHC